MRCCVTNCGFLFTGRRRARRGFSLAEAMIAMTLLALVGSALMLSVTTSLDQSQHAVEQAIAVGIAEQMIDEVLGRRYVAEGDPYNLAAMGPSQYEMAGAGRTRFNDTDDYRQFAAQPPQEPLGQPLGQENGAGGLRGAAFRAPTGYFNNWRQEFDVYYVDEADPSQRLPAGKTSSLRAIEARVLRRDHDGRMRPLTTLRRVFAYVPPSG